MGATLPPGMLGTSSRGGAAEGQGQGRGQEQQPFRSGGPSRRPTLLLLGLDLPASVRDGLREGLDHGAPNLFGGHVVGADALPSLASAVQATAAGRGFFQPCREIAGLTVAPPTSPNGEARLPDRGTKGGESTPGATATPGHGEAGREEATSLREGGTHGARGGVGCAASTRADLVQAALSEGKNVSLEVVPGPGLWARGRFLRDLEALLGGLDDGGSDGKDSDTGTRDRAGKRTGPTVLLVDGHSRNRSGGGIDLSHGTKLTRKAAPPKESIASGARSPGFPRRAPRKHEPPWVLPAASTAARRTKALMEEAAQCLHDLCTTCGETPSPFKAIQPSKVAPPTGHTSSENVGAPEAGLEKAEARGTSVRCRTRDSASERGEATDSLAAEGSPGMELLLAACHMILHPDQRYDVGEGLVSGTRAGPSSAAKKNASEKHGGYVGSDFETDNAATLAYARRLAGTCRRELAEKRPARGVAGALRGAALDAMPLETAVALRRLVRHPCWPAASPRPDLAKCSASEAFVGWIYAAVAGATELTLEGGGGTLELCSGRGGGIKSGEALHGWTKDRGIFGGMLGMRSVVKCEGSGSMVSLKDAHEERRREQEILRAMETALIDENVTVLDDDSPWFSQPETASGNGDAQQDRRQCRTSEVLNALMETALRPFNVSFCFSVFVVLAETCCSGSWIWGIRSWCSGMIICMSRGSVSPWGRPLLHVVQEHVYTPGAPPTRVRSELT